MSRAIIIHCSAASLLGEVLMIAKLNLGSLGIQSAGKDPI